MSAVLSFLWSVTQIYVQVRHPKMTSALRPKITSHFEDLLCAQHSGVIQASGNSACASAAPVGSAAAWRSVECS